MCVFLSLLSFECEVEADVGWPTNRVIFAIQLQFYYTTTDCNAFLSNNSSRLCTGKTCFKLAPRLSKTLFMWEAHVYEIIFDQLFLIHNNQD